MNESLAGWCEGVWAALLNVRGASPAVPKVHVNELCQRVGITAENLTDVMKELIELEALSILRAEEIAAISAGQGMSGDVVIINGLPRWFFLHVADPRRLLVRFAAEQALLETRLTEIRELSPVEAGRIAAEVGITADQLAEALQFELSLDDWGLMSNMPDSFYRTSWTRMEELGNAGGQMKLAATLARLIAGNSPMRVAITTRISLLTSYIDFLDSLLAAVSTSEKKPLGRDTIPEAVRHEVWRRDQGRCVACGSQERLEFDHVIPVSKGGSNTARNLQLLCEVCNRSKAAHI